MGNLFKFLFEYNDYIENIENIENSDKDIYIYNQMVKVPIIEGLIFTHPVDKSVNILKMRFP
jgi:hypothetical protein